MSKLIKSNKVCEVCGGISQMTLWRWLHDEGLRFPRPIYIKRYRYWDEQVVSEWMAARDIVASQ